MTARTRIKQFGSRIRHGGTRRAVAALRPVAHRLGVELLVRDFYSPVPQLEALPPALWERASELRGIDFDASEHLGFLEAELAGYLDEFQPPLEAGPGEFYLRNGTYGSVDAEVLYAMIRRHKPGRVAEMGSGFSSLVIGAALSRNGEEGSRARHVVFDPFPRPELEASIRAFADLRSISAAEVPLAEFESLAAGDVLFVDTTHTVKTGGEVPYLVLDVLPVLSPGVIVHFHDIFLPWEYPREWVEAEGYYWTEQYLLQAFLAFNRTYEVVFSSRAVARTFPARLARVVRSFGASNRPTALWMRRTASH